MHLQKEIVDKIARSCIELYLSLPKSGKPSPNEWTVLSGVVVVYNEETPEKLEVVSLGTGSKCIGASKMSPMGLILNDSHAEVCARRGFLLYLYWQIDRTLSNKSSIFYLKNDKLVLNDHVNFVFFSSQLPCGDASIVTKNSDEDHIGDVVKNLKRHLNEDALAIDNKSGNKDIYRTGAKCLPDDNQDLKLPGEGYHILGQVRTKPGRGDKTLSVSCSDKMAKWAHLGIQGSLLSLLLMQPIFIKHYIFGSGTTFSLQSLKRAITDRNCSSNKLIDFEPEFYQSEIAFPDRKCGLEEKPSPCSIIWCKLDHPLKEVAVLGKKLGATKKKSDDIKNSLSISKYNLFKTFLNTINKNPKWLEKITDPLDKVRYNSVKRKAFEYQNKFLLIKNIFFKTWTVKPDMWDFCVENG